MRFHRNRPVAQAGGRLRVRSACFSSIGYTFKVPTYRLTAKAHLYALRDIEAIEEQAKHNPPTNRSHQLAQAATGPRKEDRRVSAHVKFQCPHCHGEINDAIMMSWSGSLLSARARGASKARSPEAMARAARIRWEKYWQKKGGRLSNYPPLRQQKINATSPPLKRKKRREQEASPKI